MTNDDPGIPTLTHRVAGNTTPAHEASEHSSAVLAAALQAEIEDAVQDALDEALHLVKARLEERLPAIVSAAVRRTRLG